MSNPISSSSQDLSIPHEFNLIDLPEPNLTEASCRLIQNIFARYPKETPVALDLVSPPSPYPEEQMGISLYWYAETQENPTKFYLRHYTSSPFFKEIIAITKKAEKLDQKALKGFSRVPKHLLNPIPNSPFSSSSQDLSIPHEFNLIDLPEPNLTEASCRLIQNIFARYPKETPVALDLVSPPSPYPEEQMGISLYWYAETQENPTKFYLRHYTSSPFFKEQIRITRKAEKLDQKALKGFSRVPKHLLNPIPNSPSS